MDKIFNKTIMAGFVALIISASIVQGIQTNNNEIKKLSFEKKEEIYQSTERDPFKFGRGSFTADFSGDWQIREDGNSILEASFVSIRSSGEDYLKDNGEKFYFPSGLDLFFYGYLIPLSENSIFVFSGFYIAY